MRGEATMPAAARRPMIGRETAGLSLVADDAGAGGDGRFGAALHRDGYVAFPGESIGGAEFRRAAARELQAIARTLPPDPYCAGGFRYRRYSRLFLLPWTGMIAPAPAERERGRLEPVATYQQPAALNPEEHGAARRFPAFAPAIMESQWLHRIIGFDFAQLRFTDAERAGPIQVGVHVVALRPRPGVAAMASPNRVHRDGEHYTCAHLIDRHGVVGGENHIVDPEWADSDIDDVPVRSIRAAFTLERALDSYIVRDDRVAHHVAGVALAPGAVAGARTILLIDFTPMQPSVLLNPAA